MDGKMGCFDQHEGAAISEQVIDGSLIIRSRSHCVIVRYVGEAIVR